MTTAPSNLSYEPITRYAERGDHYNVYDESGHADVTGLLKRIGGTMELAHDDESQHVRQRGDFTVFIPQ